MGNTKKNLGYQSIYQILITVLPLITSPYLSRVLGSHQLGISSYTTSIAAYFTLIAMLGTANYGTRSIAACGDNKGKRSKVFWEIYSLQIIVSTISLIAYAIYLVFFCRRNLRIACIQGISVIACIIDINWLFFGIEKFKITVTRNAIIRVLAVLLILQFVRNENDTWIYILIMVGSTLLSQAVLWFYVTQYVHFVTPKMKDIFAHLIPNAMLFIPLLAMSVYHIMDKTMLGMLSNYNQSGYYYNADKIINVPVGVISGISTVMLPRMTSLISEGKKNESDSLFRLSLEGTALVGIAISIGIAAIANEFVPFFFGPGYDECIHLTIVLAPVLIIKAFAFTARYQYLIPNHQEKTYTTSVIIGAIVNLLANYYWIPVLGAMGAVIGTLLAELSACVWQFAAIRKMINVKQAILHSMIYFLFGIMMFTVVRAIAMINLLTPVKILLEIALGAVVYIGFCLVYWKLSDSVIPNLIFGKLLRRSEGKNL